jgi:hypothetical protein
VLTLKRSGITISRYCRNRDDLVSDEQFASIYDPRHRCRGDYLNAARDDRRSGGMGRGDLQNAQLMHCRRQMLKSTMSG